MYLHSLGMNSGLTLQSDELGHIAMRIDFSSRLVKQLGLLGLVVTSLMATTMAAAYSQAESQLPKVEVVGPLTKAMAARVLIAQTNTDIVDTAIAQGSFRTFINLLTELGMVDDFRGFGRFTVFAPTDAAFDAVPTEIMNILESDRELMARVLAYHAVSSAGDRGIMARDITSPQTLTTLERGEIQVTRRGGSIFVNGVRVVEPDIEASNGVIHAIDQVLISESILQEIQNR
jgi:uncharacterized surface protein with fasciclin (FAS1) repeats